MTKGAFKINVRADTISRGRGLQIKKKGMPFSFCLRFRADLSLKGWVKRWLNRIVRLTLIVDDHSSHASLLQSVPQSALASYVEYGAISARKPVRNTRTQTASTQNKTRQTTTLGHKWPLLARKNFLHLSSTPNQMILKLWHILWQSKKFDFATSKV